MPCSWRTSDLQLLLMLTVFLVAERISASSNSTQQLASSRNLNSSQLPAEVDISLPVLVDTKAVLSCSPILLTNVIITTWEIFLGDKPPCIRTQRRDTNRISKINCTDKRMTWLYRPDQIPALQIDPVAITHEGHYRCIVAAYDGNFFYEYQLQVLVAPEATLFQSENRTAVCKAVAGRPAARISWTPGGDCVPQYEYWSNGTVTVQSTCHWAYGNVSIVSCSVFHETGNWSRSIELNPGARTLVFPVSRLLIILYLKSSIFLVILIIVGIIYFQRINDCRARE
ncbi:cell surface glycoprotein CD200 receptor 1-like [Myotis daubentonii]|uniref:cell surface glycoprotein CD200 receptor 1-like n=1 Tax=Myotis daubentonii TaxID=98922 RepID=UPI0028736F38|nr:cell surface glycoprotein CD200 receptor 1-like [Myotis daubentonii]